MSTQEIERKFVAKNIPQNISPIKRQIISQGYLAIESASKKEVRLRHKGDRFYLTVKSGQGLVRGEAETEISQEQFEVLWPMTEGRRLEKERRVFLLPNGNKAEVDIFFEKLEGLVLVEVEFASEEESNAFKAPEWFEREVTTDPTFKNQNLIALNATDLCL